MYSVVRFTIAKAQVQGLLDIGAAMNTAEPGIFDGPRRAGDGFACDIERSDDWIDHVEGVEDFLDVHAASIRSAIGLGATVAFDVAIGPEDQAAAEHALVLGGPVALLKKLGDLGVAIEITIYKPRM
jgi:hypothetical protein